LDASLYEILCFFRDVHHACVVRLVLIDLFVDCLLALSTERSCAGQEDVSNDTGGPHIYLVVVSSFVAQLGGHVQGAAQGEGLGLVRSEVRGEPKVGQLDYDFVVIRLLAHEVLRLKISVHDVETVHVVQGQDDLFDDVGGLRLRELTLRLNHIKKVAASDQLHNDVVASVVLHEFEYPGDVRVDCLF